MKWFFVLLLLVIGLDANAAFTPLRTTNGGVSIADTKRITFSGFPATNQNNGRLLITSPYSGSIFNGDLAQIFTSNGLLARTASNTFSGRTITTDNGLSITNADGVSGNPRLTFDPSSLTGFVPYTGATSDVDIGTYDLITDAIKADGSGGLQLDTNTGNRVLLLGAGGGTSATAYGTWNFNGATASTIASFGAGKGLESLSTSTYPSLTELSYVKGVTSAIQTQINSKSSEANGGTMRSIQFIGDNGISFNVSSLSGNGGALRLSNNLALSTYTNDAGFLTGNQTITLSGDVTGSGTTGITTTIANSAITSGKILNGTILVADIDNGTHGYYMKSVNGSVLWATAGSSDAATLDGLDSTQFLRSDASDSYTSGTLTLDAGTTFDINSTAVSIADTNISFDGASTTFTGTGAMSIIPGAGTNFLVQQSQNGTAQFKNTSGSVIAILNSTSSYGDPSATSIFGDSVIKFQENGHTQWAMGFKANGDTFRIDDSPTFANGRFVIKNDGNVGIGITTPVHKLSVAGTINATGNITGANLSGTNTGNQTITLTGDVTGSGTGTFAATVASQTSSNWAGKVSDETGTGAWVFANTPTLVTPAIGAATGTSLVTTGKVVAGTNINGTTANFTKILDSGTLNGVSLNISNGAAFLTVKNIGNGGTTEAFDFTKANKFIMALNASTCAISASTDPRGATSLQLMIQQRAGSQTVTWTACGSASGFCWPGGTAPTLTTSANAIDVISCLYNPTKDRYYCNSSLDFR